MTDDGESGTAGARGASLGVRASIERTLPCPLRPVTRIRDVSDEFFRRGVRGAGSPVVIEGAMEGWAALRTWHDPDHLLRLIGSDTTVFCRRVVDPAERYVEQYEGLAFGEFVAGLGSTSRASHYLTQGLIFEPIGLFRHLLRAAYPALLQPLAVDCALPPFLRREELVEGMLWLGAQGQVTPLHFDESENVNCLVRGRKRWVIFPPSETRNLLVDGSDAKGSVLSSLEQLTAGGEWHGGPVTEAYTCEAVPGDMVYIPSGYAHQVYSSAEVSAAVNFWFFDQSGMRSTARLLRDHTLRFTGFRAPAKRVALGAGLLAGLTALRAADALWPSLLPKRTLEVGATSYGRSPKAGRP